jgi:EmrB/QacA subfamily drug resistance transporter
MTHETGTAPLSAAGTDADRQVRAGVILAVACLCQLMVVLDMTVVNVALPSIRADLGFSTSSLQWVVDAYTLTFGGLLLLGGRAADLAGYRRAALTGLALFGATSLLGGLAHNSAELIAARAAQGVAGAVLLPVSLTVIMTTFPAGAARHRALAIWGATAGAGGAIGVLLGGVLTEELGWRWVLFVNIPVAAVGVALARISIPARRPARRGRLDITGAALITLAMFSLVFAVVRTDQYAWGSPQTLLPLAAAVVLGGAFAVFEQRFAVTPLVRLGILRDRPLLIACTVIFFVAAGQFGAFYFASLYLQDILGYTPLATGLAFVPFSLGVIVGTIAAGRLIPRLGSRPPLLGGLVLAAAGVAWFGQVSPRGTFSSAILGPSLLASIGLGLCFVTVAATATASVAPAEAGLASGLINTCRQCGGSIGLAVLVTVANTVTRDRMELPAAVTAGYDRAFWVAGVLIAISAIAVALFLRRREPVKTVTAVIDIHATPAHVWEVLTDLSRYPEWNPHIRAGTGQVAAGNRLTLRMYPPKGRPVTIRPLVLAAVPGAEWRLRGGLPGILGRLIFTGEHSFTLTPVPGGTRVAQSETFRGALVPFIGKTLTAAQHSFQEHNEALRKRVEGGQLR